MAAYSYDRTVTSGKLMVDVDPREVLVRGSVDFLSVAAALPYSKEDERVVAKRVAQVLGDEEPRPLRRKPPQKAQLRGW